MSPRILALALSGVLFAASPALAQVPGFGMSKQFKLDRLSETHWRATGQVEMQRGDLSFFADVVDYHTDTEALEASGNVVFVSRDGRIAAERAEFNTRTRTGVFHTASGSASLGERGTKSMFGTQEPDAYFYGETIEKLGPSKYRIVHGGFTTCLQPTPRWEIVAASAVITLDEYAVLRHSVLRVKGVPMLYLPIMYYPIKEEDRATGFLIPVYGSSKVRGQSLSNAFFWAIDRSQDATVFHDYFSKTGQGVGGEYRYIASQGSDGQVRMYWLNEKGTTYESDAGTTELPARKSYELRGYAQQTLPFNLRARFNVDYFSDITVQQLYHNNLYDASRRQRLYGGNVAGSWGGNRVSFTYSRNELFYGTTDSQVYGGAPRITFDRSSLRVARTPLYFNLGAEYNNILRSTNFAGREYDQGLTRMEVRPAVTAPFTQWPFLTINAAAAFYATWYSESLNERGIQVAEPISRNYLELRADTVGPKFQRVWSTPDNGYAEKFKHVIEPNFSVQRTTLIDNFDAIVKNESNDYVLGGTTRLSYGLTNRFLAKRRGGTGQAREFLNVTLFQSYYSDPRASQYDPSYGTSFAGRPPSSYSPIAFGARVSPTDRLNGALRLEYDYQLKILQSLRANGSYALSDVFQVQAGWSQRNYSTSLYQTDNYLDISTSARTPDGRIGGHYSFNYDFRRETLLQQSLQAYYNAQCCGVVVEFQRFGYPRFDPRYPVEADRRFTISFTLAGVGTFSPFLGAFGSSMSSGGRGF